MNTIPCEIRASFMCTEVATTTLEIDPREVLDPTLAFRVNHSAACESCVEIVATEFLTQVAEVRVP